MGEHEVEVALSRFKIGAHFWGKGKGGTYPKVKGHLIWEKSTCQSKRGITRGENGALLAPKKGNYQKANGTN